MKAADPDWVDRPPSPPQPPMRKYGNKEKQRPIKRQKKTVVSDDSCEDLKDDSQKEMKEPQSGQQKDDSQEINVRPQRNAKPRYQMVDEGSEAGSIFERQAGWNGNMNSEDDDSEDDE